MPPVETKTSDQILDSIVDAATGKALDDVQTKAPAFIGRPVFEADLKWAELAGYKSIPQMFGHNVGDKADVTVLPLNFGSKSAIGSMPHEVAHRLLNLKKQLHNSRLQAEFMHPGKHISKEMIMDTPCFKNFVAPTLKAYNVTDFSNWLEVTHSRFYFEEFEIPFLLADSFDQVPMDSTTMEVPGDLGLLEGHEETDAATFTAQSTTQSNYSVTARNNVVHAQITEDLVSDSAPAYMEKLRKNVVKGIARAYEKCIINGDTTGSPRGASHMDSDTAALALNATFQKAFKGIRKLGLEADAAQGAGKVAYDHGGDTASKPMFAKVMSLMGKFATEKDDLIWVLPSSIENQLVTGAIPELFTAFAFGGMASNVTGQVPPVFGIKCVTSQYVREDLNASGVYAAASTMTHIALIKKSRYANFVRQAVRIWAAPSLPSSDIMLMTAKMRHSWAGNPLSSAEKGITLAYNIATS